VDRHEHVADLVLLGLAGDGAQRLLERADLDERRQLPGEDGELAGVELLADEQPARQQSGCGLGAGALHFDHEQAARAQLLPGLVGSLGAKRAAPLAPGAVEHEIGEFTHDARRECAGEGRGPD
jgi:hypothetical protein